MNKARTISSVLMILVGLALVASPARSAVDVGGTQVPWDPCQEQSSILIAVAALCDPPVTRPEITTTTVVEETTTTVVQTTTTVVDEPTTTVDRPTTTTATTAPATTVPTGVGGSGGHRPPTATQGGALARTGSSTAPMTAAGVALAGLGVVLLVAERRRAAGRI